MPTVTGIATEFIQFTRASNATVTDSDGKVKWAPHNLLLASESFDASAWGSKAYVTANAAVAPNGTTTADRINNTGAADNVAQTATVAPGVSYTFSFWAKNNGGTTANYRVYDNTNLADIVGVTSYFSLINGSTWTQITVTFTAPAGCTTANCYVTATNGPTNNIFVWGAALYRSDLAMQPNTSAYPMYNPTTPKNLLGYTEDFSNANWFKTAATVTANAELAPNGLQIADKLVEDATTSGHYIRQTATVVSGGRYTLSFYAKAAERSWVAINAVNPAVSDNYTYFNLTGSGSVGTNDPDNTASITSVGNGWYRCAISHTMQSAQTSVLFIIYTAIADNTNSHAGVLGSGIYLWGAQLSDSASLDPYVPVYGAAVTSAAYYGPRRDFDGATLACKGLLVEEQRANLTLNSAAFDAAYWTKEGASVTANAVTSPDGTVVADKLIEAAITDRHILYVNGVTVTASIAYSLSVAVKMAERRYVCVGFDTSTNPRVYADLQTGTITDQQGTATGSIVSLGNGWYRITCTAAATTTTLYPLICMSNRATAVGGNLSFNCPSYAGDGTSGIYIWGAQLEAGSFATSYIPVGATTAGATRLADVASVSTQAFPYSASTGSLVINYNYIGSALGYPVALETATGASFYGVSHVANSLNTSQGAVSISPVLNATGLNKVATAYATNDLAVSANGNSANTSASSYTPFTAVNLNIGSYFNLATYRMTGHIRQITYIPRRLSNAELQSRST